MAQTRRRHPRLAVRVRRLRPQHGHSELVVTKIAGCHRLHLRRADAAQTFDQPVTGIQWQNVPYKTTPQAAGDTMAGITQIYINGVPPIAPMIRGGALRVLGVSSLKRLPNFPDIPAMSEVAPGFVMVGWFGLMAPLGTQAEVIAKVNQDTNTVLKNPQIAERMLQLGMYDPGGTPEEFGRFIADERARWASAVKAAKIEPE